MLMCKIRPDISTCRMCIDNDELFSEVRNCSDCLAQSPQCEIINVGSSFWSGNYAMVLKGGNIQKISLRRIYDVKEKTNGK